MPEGSLKVAEKPLRTQLPSLRPDAPDEPDERGHDRAPAVSVVIPSYRGGRYLRESVASVRAQTFKDWEIVVVADGCEEDLSDLEEDPRVRVFTQPTRGVSIARNVGISLARSELIAFLDDDDRMMPDRLMAQFQVMKDMSIGLCYSQFRVIDEDGEIAGHGATRDLHYRDFLRVDGSILLSTTMLRKSVLLEVGGFNPLLGMGEDLDIIFRVARESCISFIPEDLAEYRSHGTNTWLNSSSSSGQEIKMILTQHRWAAEAHRETENLHDIRIGMKHVLPSRTQFALQRAQKALVSRHYAGLVLALAEAVVFSPRVAVRVAVRKARRVWRQNHPA